MSTPQQQYERDPAAIYTWEDTYKRRRDKRICALVLGTMVTIGLFLLFLLVL